MNKLAVIGLAVAMTGHLSAQSPETRPSFEVASIKPNKSGGSQRAMGPEPGGRFGATNVPLRDLMTIAYGIPPYLVDHRISGGPADLLGSILRNSILSRKPRAIFRRTR